LTAYIGALFGDDVVSTGLLSKDYGEGGIFFYSEDEKERIENLKHNDMHLKRIGLVIAISDNTNTM